MIFWTRRRWRRERRVEEGMEVCKYVSVQVWTYTLTRRLNRPLDFFIFRLTGRAFGVGDDARGEIGGEAPESSVAAGMAAEQ